MVIKLYKNLSDNRTLNKKLSDMIEIEGTLKNPLNLMDIIFTLNYEAINNYDEYNYCEINGIYYFITNKALINNSLITFNLHIDVLMTYKDLIKDIPCIVARNENKYNAYFHDSELNQYSYKAIQTKLFTNNDVFSGNSFLVTTV